MLLVRAVLTFLAKIMELRSEEMTNSSPLLTQRWALHCNPGHSPGPWNIFFSACPQSAFCPMAVFVLTLAVEMRRFSLISTGEGRKGKGHPGQK